MKHIIYKVFSVVKKIFFFFRVIVALGLGKSSESDTDKRGDHDD